MISSTGVSLAISSACSSNSSLAGSSASFLPSFLLLEGLPLLTGFSSFSSSTASSTSAPSGVTATLRAKIRSIISSLVPVHLTPKEDANFLNSLYFIELSCSTLNLPVISVLPSVSSTGGFITGSSSCAFSLLATDLVLAGVSTAVSSESAILIASRPVIVASIPLISSTLFILNYLHYYNYFW